MCLFGWYPDLQQNIWRAKGMRFGVLVDFKSKIYRVNFQLATNSYYQTLKQCQTLTLIKFHIISTWDKMWTYSKFGTVSKLNCLNLSTIKYGYFEGPKTIISQTTILKPFLFQIFVYEFGDWLLSLFEKTQFVPLKI